MVLLFPLIAMTILMRVLTISSSKLFLFWSKISRLICDIKEFMVSFASLAWDFIKCGENDTNRKDILTNPYGWFENGKICRKL